MTFFVIASHLRMGSYKIVIMLMDFPKHTFSSRNLSLNQEMIAGGLAGLCQITVTSPMELVKVQLQDAGRVSNLEKSFNKTVIKLSARNIALRLFREKGILGFYKGFGATALRDGPFSIIYFPLFAFLNQYGPRNGNGHAYFFISFASGFGAAAVAAFAVTPFDVVKTRVQVHSRAKGEMQFNGVLDCFV